MDSNSGDVLLLLQSSANDCKVEGEKTVTDFQSLWLSATKIVDWLFLFSFGWGSIHWMLGDRTKAVERCIGTSIGYILFRASPLVLAFLRKAVG